MSHPKEADIAALIRALVEARVEFIVVGGAAGVIHGAPITTEDLDIVHRRTPDNVDRLMGVLEQLDAYHRHDLANRRLKPTRAMLLGAGQINLSTALGPLDPLCELSPGEGYEELLAQTETLSDGTLEMRVLTLDKLIEVKASAGRDKDRLAVPVLIATLQERNQRK
ncbi:MAG: hypothetical protein DRI90_14540 [Deltaproteobacteria bacterium]|nr:MAG: hypothetical protein DRI90_14540 [Deltaproteobacteria bacterium]